MGQIIMNLQFEHLIIYKKYFFVVIFETTSMFVLFFNKRVHKKEVDHYIIPKWMIYHTYVYMYNYIYASIQALRREKGYFVHSVKM